jgi:carbon storage regulator
MLILSRRQGEAIRIGDNIEVKVMACSGGNVRIGISAPSEIPVHREEIYERIRAGAAPKPEQDADLAATI